MKVLWVADKLGYGDRLHGLGAYYRQIVPALPRGLVVPAVLRCTEGITRQMAEVGVELRDLERGRLDPFTLGTLTSLVHREGISALHLHGYGSSTFGRIAARRTGIPAIIHQHDDSRHAPWYGRILDRWLAGATYRALAVSEGAGRYCASRRFVPADRVIVLPNAVAAPDPHHTETLEAFRVRHGLPAGGPIVGTVTRLRKEKGVQVLIEAWADIAAELPRAHLVIFGDGEQRKALEQRARDLGIDDRVHFIGFLSDAQRYLTMMDTFVMPSLHEGMPFALLEALSVSLPIVATRVGGMAEQLTDGENAVMVEAGDRKQLAQALTHVLQRRDLRETLRQGAEALASRFRMEHHVEQLVSLYHRAVEEGGG